jgi:hypothetical protein
MRFRGLNLQTLAGVALIEIKKGLSEVMATISKNMQVRRYLEGIHGRHAEARSAATGAHWDGRCARALPRGNGAIPSIILPSDAFLYGVPATLRTRDLFTRGAQPQTQAPLLGAPSRMSTVDVGIKIFPEEGANS